MSVRHDYGHRGKLPCAWETTKQIIGIFKDFIFLLITFYINKTKYLFETEIGISQTRGIQKNIFYLFICVS